MVQPDQHVRTCHDVPVHEPLHHKPGQALSSSPENDVSAPASHVGRNGHSTWQPRLGDHLALEPDLLRGELVLKDRGASFEDCGGGGTAGVWKCVCV